MQVDPGIRLTRRVSHDCVCDTFRHGAKGIARELAIHVLAIGRQDVLLPSVKRFRAHERHQDHLPRHLVDLHLGGQADRGFDAGVLPAMDPRRDEERLPLVDAVHQRQRHADVRAGDLEESGHLPARLGGDAPDLQGSFHAGSLSALAAGRALMRRPTFVPVPPGLVPRGQGGRWPLGWHRNRPCHGAG